MKLRKKDMVLRGDRNTGKWYLAEGVKTLADGTQCLSGRVYEVTESIEPAVTHTNEYVRRLEDSLVELVKELFDARGMTCTSEDIRMKFDQIRQKIRPDS